MNSRVLNSRVLNSVRFRMILLGAMMVVPMVSSFAETSVDPYANESVEQKDARMQWWREARFGMFIHWGVYAVPAGVYRGEKWGGVCSWMMLTKRIPVSEYRAFANDFNPVKYDPTAWAKLAKEAGMRYIVITSKHHDGFALFPSAASDWDIEDATPYRKDLIGPLAKATRDEGLKFGLYYSQAQDWVNPGGAKATNHGFSEGGGWDEAHKGDFDQYLKNIAVPQVEEILTRYQPDVLWWDTAVWMNNERAERLLPLLPIKPGIITNNRLVGRPGNYQGDYDTPEQFIPGTGHDDRDWEVCMTMNDTWGYKTHDHNWKSAEDLIRKLCDIVGKGGNFLLNVGPNAEGEIPLPSIERLKAVGAWMDINSESIYGTTANPFYHLEWGRCTKKLRPDGATLYLQVFDWPEDRKLVVPGLKNKPTSVSLLQNGESLRFQQLTAGEGGLVIDLPALAPDANVSVIKLEIDGELNIESNMLKQQEDGRVELTPSYARLHNVPNSTLKLVKTEKKTSLQHWNKDRAWVEWEFRIERPGTFKVLAELAAESESNLFVSLEMKGKDEVVIEPTGSLEKYTVQDLGEVKIPKAGVCQLIFRPVGKEWKPVNVGTVILKSVK